MCRTRTLAVTNRQLRSREKKIRTSTSIFLYHQPSSSHQHLSPRFCLPLFEVSNKLGEKEEKFFLILPPPPSPPKSRNVSNFLNGLIRKSTKATLYKYIRRVLIGSGTDGKKSFKIGSFRNYAPRNKSPQTFPPI